MSAYAQEDRAAALENARAAAALLLAATRDGGASSVGARLLAATDSRLHSFDLMALCTNLENAVGRFVWFVLGELDDQTKGDAP